MPIEPFEVFAIRYAHLGDRHPGENFALADPHEYASDLDYFVWVARRNDRTFVIDTGFAEEAAARRKRELLRNPADALRLLAIDPDHVTDVILSHLHYDHAGNLDRFPRARFHLQDREMAYATGRCMCHAPLQAPFDLDNILQMVRHVFAARAEFHEGDTEIVPGLTLHRVGGHSAGLQIVRVWTRRGWVVLAADASHLYDHFQKSRIFPVVYNVAEMLEGYKLLYRLADSPAHIVPGHDPLVMKYYPAVRADMARIVVRLDVEPSGGQGA
ncbi:MAG TPA: N-acyl homoserine lactonase family protein [Bryobacteraceae bacterium]|nr:N-acyl homoserine lactonase family protein [Bryobacteraceae bacterium]